MKPEEKERNVSKLSQEWDCNWKKKAEAFTVARVETNIGIIFFVLARLHLHSAKEKKKRKINYHMQDIKGQLNLVSAGSKKK